LLVGLDAVGAAAVAVVVVVVVVVVDVVAAAAVLLERLVAVATTAFAVDVAYVVHLSEGYRPFPGFHS